MASAYYNQLNRGEWVSSHRCLEHATQTLLAEHIYDRGFLNALEPKGGCVVFVVDTAMAVDYQNLWLFTKRALEGLVIQVTF